MANINSVAAYQQVLSMALEARSPGYQDLVANNNALYAVLKKKGMWQTYSGPRIRQTLQISKQQAQWYSGYDPLLNPAIDLFNDAVWDGKQVVVPVILSMQEILNNQGSNQLMDVFDSYISAAERALEDAFDAGLYSNGSANGGKQITGLATAIPIVTNTGNYGGIDRSLAPIWQTQTYDAQSMATAIGTQVTAATVRPFLNVVMTKQSRGRDYADLLIMSPEHYAAYDAACVAIQRQTNETSLGKLGFSAIEYIGGGKRAEIVLDGGIGSNMPSDTTFGINTDTLRVRYHPQRNFDRLFEGDGQMPIDKDAIAQFIGWMGELTMTNPMFNWRFYDSNIAALMAADAGPAALGDTSNRRVRDEQRERQHA
jgi:hypothetical protein